MFSLVLLVVTPWLVFCMPPPTTTSPTPTPPNTTTPTNCTCSDGTQILPGEYHSLTDCDFCYCNEDNLEAYETHGDCYIAAPCVDSVKNTRRVLSLLPKCDGLVDFGLVDCQCDNDIYHGNYAEPLAACRPKLPTIGDNCQAEFKDDNGVERSELIYFSDGVVKFNSTECKCVYREYYYYREPKANCVQVLSIEPGSMVVVDQNLYRHREPCPAERSHILFGSIIADKNRGFACEGECRLTFLL
ncbi:hypothetical protein LOTGIDRAFT_157022 [Lottia gigantea]|uniref:VWFD domain-containing protein n=1 Tax=Lottia gigantea TaxID=225164 RepID=V4B694_LOTGI|nr:hypothetical protein LOTGIDRAFT_157022 [Lottia gigantea]ESP03061.1 hypothetical protein LOTGIDRAFT_157022 [Lottia gigantea]